MRTSPEIQEKLFLRIDGQSETWKHLSDNTFVRTRETPDIELKGASHQIRNYLVPSSYNSLLFLCNGLLIPNDFTSKSLQYAMELTLQGHPVPQALEDMHFAGSPAIYVKVAVTWALGVTDYSPIILANGALSRDTAFKCILTRHPFQYLHCPSGCTVGMALTSIRDALSNEWVTEDPKSGINLTGTPGSIVQRKQFGTYVKVSRVHFTLQALMLPTNLDRKACLPLPEIPVNET